MSLPSAPTSPSSSPKVPEQDRLQIASRAWILWLQGIFSYKEPGDHRWDENPELSEIYIASSEPQGSEGGLTRPRVIVTRGTIGWASLSYAQRSMPMFGSSNSETFSDLASVTFQITCVAQEGLEAQQIAWDVFRLIPVFKVGIQKLARLHGISNGIQMSPETPHGQMYKASPTPEWKAVQVTVPCHIQTTQKITHEQSRALLQSIEQKMEQSAGGDDPMHG